MKKLEIVLAALLLACVFVGCGPVNMLKGTQWYEEYEWQKTNWKDTYSFEAEGVFKYTHEQIDEGVANDPKTHTGTWATEGVDILITDIDGQSGVTGTWTVAFDEENKDILILTRDSDEKVLKLNRVTE